MRKMNVELRVHLVESELTALKERIKTLIESGDYGLLPTVFEEHEKTFNQTRESFRARGLEV